MRQTGSYALGGGLDEQTQPLAIDPGKAIAAVNHEVVGSGYARIDGFERFDGQTSPTDFPFYLLNFDSGSTQFQAGDVVLGQTSGATGTVLVDAVLESGAWDGTGVGLIGLRSTSGTFVLGENLLVGGAPYATASGSAVLGEAGSGNATEEAISLAARNYARALIQALPGSGPVRGVWEFGGVVYAFRDNSSATAGVMHKSTSSGWVPFDLGFTLDYTSGSTEIAEGSTITGATSGATATVKRLIVQSGDWGTGDAAGYLVLADIVGTFQAEDLDVGASSNVATIAGDAVAITLPAGGRYFFDTHNFYGASSLRRVYGCNGVGTGFEFDATTFVPIRTGMPTDTPNRVAVFRNHLFFAFPGGSIQNSATGDPVSWEAVLGAAEIGVGSDVVDFIINVDGLIILGEHGVFNLTGYDATDFQLNVLTHEAGALPFTGQRFGPGIYLDNRGLRSIEATQAFGNYKMGTLTRAVQKTLRRKAEGGFQPIASTIVRSKDHYRLFYDDGTGLSFYMGRGAPEPMYFNLGKVVRCISSNESDDGTERIFFGSDDGYVYELEKGSSFDGEDIEAFIQLAYANLGSPNVVKRVHKLSFEVTSEGGTTIGCAVEYDYSNNEQTSGASSDVTIGGQGALWNIGNWDEFFWSSPVENVLEIYVDGQGRNASPVIYSAGENILPYTMRGVTFYYSPRGQIR